MKKSDTLLWGAIGALFGGVIAFLILVGIFTEPVVKVANSAPANIEPGPMVDKRIDLKDFDTLRASGSWKIKMFRSDTYAVNITVPEGLLPYVRVEKEGAQLRLGLDSGLGSKAVTLHARIAQPVIKSMRLSGAVKVDFRGFETDRLSIRASGATKILGRRSQIKLLNLKGSGACTADLSDSPVGSAELALSGASKVDLTMAGGDLNGKISGSGEVTYAGQIRNQNIRISGSGSVSQRGS